MLCSKCSPSNIRRNETNDQHSFLVQWLIRRPGKQEMHGLIPCEGRVLFFCSVLWSYHHLAISVIRTRQTRTSEGLITMVHWPGSNIQHSPEWHYTWSPWKGGRVMFEVFPFEHKTWSTLLSSTVVNTSTRKAGDAWFDSMRRESIILLFRSVVISSPCYFGDKNKTNYNERGTHNNGALAGKQHTALPRVALHVILVEGGTCYVRSVPLRT